MARQSRYQSILKFLPVIGIVVLIYILSQLDIPAVIAIFSSLNPWYCLLAVFSFIPILLLVNIEWQMILRRQGIHVSFIYSIKNILIGYFYGFITPGGLGGYLQTLYLKQECKEPLPKCASNIVTFHMVDFLTLLGFAVAGGILLIGNFPLLFVILVIIFGFSVVLFFLFLNKRTHPFFKRLLQTRLLRFIQRYFEDPLESFFEEVLGFKDVVLPFIVSVMGWIVAFTELFFIAKLFQINVPYVYFICMIAMANIVALIPISIYGIGTREATLISLFSLFGVESERIVSLSLFWYVLVWVLPSLVGAIITVREHKRMADIRKEAEESSV